MVHAKRLCMMFSHALLTLLLTACGQVITRPTATPLPSPTPTASPTVLAQAQPTATPEPGFTPPPTATPTTTPTPTYYRIQAGENLFIIADKFGVSHDALRDVNEIENERALQVGQLLLIPLSGETAPPEPTATATPTPLPIGVENVYFHPSPLGELTVLGEARNLGAGDVERVLVQVTLFDVADQPMIAGRAYTELEFLSPGQRAPFVIRFPEGPAVFASYQAEVLSAAPAYTGSLHRDLEPIDVISEQPSRGPLRLSGRIMNTGSAEAVQTMIVITAYDPLGRVVAVRRVAPDHSVVARGGEVTFQAEVVAAGPVASYAIQVQGRRLTPTPATGG
jgi:LysM repeat protein